MIDAHCHLETLEYGKELSELSKKELETEIKNLVTNLNKHSFDKGLVYLLDEKLKAEQLLGLKVPDNILLSPLVNPFSKKLENKLSKLKKSNIVILKLLPYEQKILKNDFSKLSNFIRLANKYNMIVTVCCAYGSRYLYDTNGVELTAHLLNNGIKAPVIMAHGGMPKIFDAMSLMLEFPNLYMDISFTLPYWWGSTIIDNYAFALNKLDYNRIFYGSDYPYISLEESFDFFEKFVKKYNISNRDKNKILKDNFNNFLSDNF